MAGSVVATTSRNVRLSIAKRLGIVGITLTAALITTASFFLSLVVSVQEPVSRERLTLYHGDLSTVLAAFLQPSSAKLANVAKPMPLGNNEEEESLFIHDNICPGCRGDRKRNLCGKNLRLVQANENVTEIEAGIEVARKFPKRCGMCDPSACTDSAKRYWHVDAVAPKVIHAQTHFLTSIQLGQRIPVGALSNLSSFVSAKENVYPEREYLFEFNPSLVKLPLTQIPRELSQGSKLPVYLASYRVSTGHNCISDREHLHKLLGGSSSQPKVRNYLGLALLDADLSILHDTLLDGRSVFRAHLEDPRLFVLNDQIYVGSRVFVLPLWLVPPSSQIPDVVTLPQLMPSNLTVFFRSFPSCIADRYTQRRGKNLNYFVDAENRTVMESTPLGQKAVVDMNKFCILAKTNDPPADWVNNISSAHKIVESFGTADEIAFSRFGLDVFPVSSPRGGACCISIRQPGSLGSDDDLLLGISHVKTQYDHKEGKGSKWGFEATHVFSVFYAMEAKAPYNVVARSGKFCFGFSKPSSYGMGDGGKNPYVQMNTDRLHIGTDESETGETTEVRYDCPRIHFVSGMVEKADDPSKLVISYGINDCIPRMIVIEKADILRMLFDPQDME